MSNLSLDTTTFLSRTAPPLRAKFKQRSPDPGVCVVRAIDWDHRRVTMTCEGSTTYFPDFRDIDIVAQSS